MIVTACECGHLISVMDEHRARELSPSDLDGAAKLALMPRFIGVVSGLIDRGWIEVYEDLPDRRESLRGDLLTAALSDPASWLCTVEGDHRLLELLTSDSWDNLVEAG